jgi:CheY-like chemotaxis protein
MTSVLVVDDNHLLAENLAEILEDEGCEVALANSGEEALEIADARHFDLVLTDIRMPGINGVELVRRLSALDPRAKFLLMTAYTSDSLLREAQTLGVVRAVLAKPLAIQQLLAMLPRDGGTCVLVEDDAGLAAMIGESMRVHGFTVEVAPSTEGAREAVRRRRPDVAVIDLKLSDGGASQLAREFSGAVAVVGQPTMPVVVITGMGREGAEARIELGQLAAGGVVQFLSKPFAAESLLSALQNAVQGI